MASIIKFPPMQVGEVGKKLTFTQGTNSPSMTSSTVHLVVKNPSGAINLYLCDSSTAIPYRISTGAEFPSPGLYFLQLKYENSGELYWSDPGEIQILPNLQ